MTVYRLADASGYRTPGYYDFKPNIRLCLLEMEKERTDEAGFMKMDHRILAQVAKVDPRTAKKALQELGAAGYIQYFEKAGIVHLTNRMYEQLKFSVKKPKYYIQNLQKTYDEKLQYITSFYKNCVHEIGKSLQNIKSLFVSILTFKHTTSAQHEHFNTPLLYSDSVCGGVDLDIDLDKTNTLSSKCMANSLPESVEREVDKIVKTESPLVKHEIIHVSEVSEREIDISFSQEETPSYKLSQSSPKSIGSLMGSMGAMFGGKPPRKDKDEQPSQVADHSQEATPLDAPMVPKGEAGQTMKQKMQARIDAMMARDTDEVKAARAKRRDKMQEVEQRAELMKEQARWAVYEPFMKADAKKCVWAMYREYFGGNPSDNDKRKLAVLASGFGSLDETKKKAFMDVFLQHGEKAKSLNYIFEILKNEKLVY